MNSRRDILASLSALGAASAFQTAAASSAAPSPAEVAAERRSYRDWVQSVPAAPAPELNRFAARATEVGRWRVIEANQAAAADRDHFFGIGNHVLVKHRKDSGEKVAEWIGPRGGPIAHFNSGYVADGKLVLAHSNFSQLPMASSVEIHDAETLAPISSYSFGIRLGSLTWATRYKGYWWACFANYNDSGTTPGFDQRWTYFGQFDARWQLLQSWIFPPQVVATWGVSSCSGGDWGNDGLLYTTGHDAPEMHVLRLPKQGVSLEYITTIDVPFEGQGWAWDPGHRGRRRVFGISRRNSEIVAADIPVLPSAWHSRA
jgi:hypothetical protein